MPLIPFMCSKTRELPLLNHHIEPTTTTTSRVVPTPVARPFCLPISLLTAKHVAVVAKQGILLVTVTQWAACASVMCHAVATLRQIPQFPPLHRRHTPTRLTYREDSNPPDPLLTKFPFPQRSHMETLPLATTSLLQHLQYSAGMRNVVGKGRRRGAHIRTQQQTEKKHSPPLFACDYCCCSPNNSEWKKNTSFSFVS